MAADKAQAVSRPDYKTGVTPNQVIQGHYDGDAVQGDRILIPLGTLRSRSCACLLRG